MAQAPRDSIILVHWNDYSKMLDHPTWEELARALVERGWGVSCYFGTTSAEPAHYPFVKLIRVTHLRVLKYLQFLAVLGFKLNLQVKREHPRLVILDVFTFFIVLPAVFLARDTKFIIDYRTFLRDDGASLIRRVFYHAITVASLLFGRYVLDGYSFIVPEMLTFVSRFVDLRRARYFIWSSGVRPDNFANAAAPDRQSTPIRFFYHGHLTDNRGLENALVACKELRAHGVDFSLTFVGDGPARPKLERVLRDLQLTDRCVIKDTVPHDEIKHEIAAADVALMPYPNSEYRNNNNPIKLLEYMIMEKFVVVTGIPAFRRVLEGYPAKLIIENNSVSDIASALMYCIEQKEGIRGMRVPAAKRLLEKYTYAEQAKRIIDFADS
jgi:glycosyltransferase involved in cell wall biosynthesis